MSARKKAPKPADASYAIHLRWSGEDGAWIAEVPELPGCMADGETEAAAISAAREAIRLWIDVAREDGREIPRPQQGAEPSGRFVVRIPRSLHGRLQYMARREGVSLNQLVLTMLAAHEAKRSQQAPAIKRPARKKSG